MTRDNKSEIATKTATKSASTMARRDVLRVVGLGASAAVVPPFVREAKADSENDNEKRKARYNANSADVKAFYRVNSYPK